MNIDEGILDLLGVHLQDLIGDRLYRDFVPAGTELPNACFMTSDFVRYGGMDGSGGLVKCSLVVNTLSEDDAECWALATRVRERMDNFHREYADLGMVTMALTDEQREHFTEEEAPTERRMYVAALTFDVYYYESSTQANVSVPA